MMPMQGRTEKFTRLASGFTTAVAFLLRHDPVGAATGAAHANAPSAHATEQLPQFMTEFYPGQLFWLIVTFGLLYYLMVRVALPRVQKVQETRYAALSADLKAASLASDEARKIMKQYESALASARTQAQTSVNDLVERTKAESARYQAAQRQELTRRMEEAERRIRDARTEANGHIQEMAVDLARETVRKISGLETSPSHLGVVVERLQQHTS